MARYNITVTNEWSKCDPVSNEYAAWLGDMDIGVEIGTGKTAESAVLDLLQIIEMGD